MMINKIVVFVFGLGFMFYCFYIYCIVCEEKVEFYFWLKEYNFLDYEVKLYKFGMFYFLLFFYDYKFFFGNRVLYE